MLRHPLVMTQVLVLIAACGGGDKPKPKKPAVVEKEEKAPPPETEADREAKRLKASHAIIPEGATCLPTNLKDDGAPRLELAAIESAAVVCAIDTDETRLLGPVGCWTVDLATGVLTYKDTAPLPGHGIAVNLDDRSARGYVLPADAKVSGKKVFMAWNVDGSKVAVLAGDDVHLFDSASKAHEKSFTIRGEKAVAGDASAVHWLADSIFVEADGGVWTFKADGTPVGAIEPIGAKDGKPASTKNGSFSLLDKTRVGVSENGLSLLHVYETDTGKRSKLVRKVAAKSPCKPAETTAFWADQPDAVGAKCKDYMTKNYRHLMGATAVAGKTNFLLMLRGDRLGELAVMDAKTLAEKKSIKLPWCEGGSAAATAETPAE